MVRRDEIGVVNLHRGAARSTYNCSPQCNPTLTIGDDAGYFAQVQAASQNKASFSEKASDQAAQASSQ